MKILPGMVRLLIFLLVSLLMRSTPAEETYNNIKTLEMIENGGVQLGVKLDAGGRVVLLRRNNEGNVLQSNPKLWEQRPPETSANAPWKNYGGHIIWVGPQQMFHSRQLPGNPEPSDKTWPPDPYLIYGRYKIIEKSQSHLLLEGPPSKLCGLKLTKEYKIDNKGTVSIKVTARNCESQPVYANLWSNTRVPEDSEVFSCSSGKQMKVEYRFWEPCKSFPLPWQDKNEIFHFFHHSNSKLLNKYSQILGKAFLYPDDGVIIAAGENNIFIKTFSSTQKNKLDKEHGAVEIYQKITGNSSGIAELEFHGEYRKLQPGEKIYLHETWQIIPRDKTQANLLPQITKIVQQIKQDNKLK